MRQRFTCTNTHTWLVLLCRQLYTQYWKGSLLTGLYGALVFPHIWQLSKSTHSTSQQTDRNYFYDPFSIFFFFFQLVSWKHANEGSSLSRIQVALRCSVWSFCSTELTAERYRHDSSVELETCSLTRQRVGEASLRLPTLCCRVMRRPQRRWLFLPKAWFNKRLFFISSG